MQEMMKLRIKNVKMVKMLKKRNEMLRQRDKELQAKEREHKKLQRELKNLWKIKEFKYGRDKTHKEKKKYCPEK